MKTKEELTALKEEVETLNKKLAELTEEELRLVVGGTGVDFFVDDGSGDKEYHFYDNNIENNFRPKY